MKDSRKCSFPASPDQGQSSVTPEEAARRAAAARAYALSSSLSSAAGKDVTPQQRPSKGDHLNASSPLFNANNPYLPPRSKTPTRDSSKSGKTLVAKNHAQSLNRVAVSTKHRLEELDRVDDQDYANFMKSLLMDDLDDLLSEREMDTEDDEDYQCEEEQVHDDDDDDDDDNDEEGEEEEEKGEGGDDQEQEGEKRGQDNGHLEGIHDPMHNRIDNHHPTNKISHDHHNNDDGSTATDFFKPFPLDDTDLFLDPIALEEELGSLLEEDMEAAVNSLLQQQPDVPVNQHGGGLGMSGGGRMHTESTACLDSSSETDGPKDHFSRSPKEYSSSSTKKMHESRMSFKSEETKASSKSTNKFPTPSEDQILQLKNLMNQHYQILLQQATLAVRAAHGNKFKASNRGMNKRKRVETFFCCGETADDLAGILDGAVTMLQDLDKHRKDAIRYSIQMRRVRGKKIPRIENGTMVGNGRNGNMQNFYSGSAPSAARAILGDECDSTQDQGILTRSAFSRTLRESDWMCDVNVNNSFGMAAPSGGLSGSEQRAVMDPFTTTIFGVRGLARLNETFSAIDNSISAYSDQNAVEAAGPVSMRPTNSRMIDVDNIFCEPDHGHACEMLLQHARADYDRNLIPGCIDLSQVLTYPSEIMGSDVGMPMNKEQQKLLRQNKLQFTAAEDNLLLRGVNLYGEKEWVFISDRFLPDRSVSVVAQRYWRLCLLIYRGHGVQIDPNGKLQEQNLPNGIDDLDERAVQRALKPVTKPTVYGLYRWTMEEDLLLLKAVPIMGRMFAEIGKRFIPYRDRGALRKRYQVLERRVKGAMKRDKKAAIESKKRGNAVLKNPKTTTSFDYQNDSHSFYMKHPVPTNLTEPIVSSGFHPRPIVNNNTTNNLKNNNNTMYHSTHPASIPSQPSVYPPIPKGSGDSYSAFGRVIEGEWSQFSKTVEEIIDENASKLLNMGSSQSAMLPASQFLPNIDYNNDSLSGLSALAATESNLGNFKKGDSIMKLVMHQSSDPEAFQKAKGIDQDMFRKDEMSQVRKGFPSYDHHEFYHDLSFQRHLPPPSQINSNLSFFGSGMTTSQNMDHSLMAPPEMYAASALNQMSNSGSIGFNPPNSYQKDNMKKENPTSKKAKTSFFEKVVGSNNKK